MAGIDYLNCTPKTSREVFVLKKKTFLCLPDPITYYNRVHFAGPDDMTIGIWDVETCTVVGEALKRHTGGWSPWLTPLMDSTSSLDHS